MALPILTTSDDVLRTVKYLKNKPAGASLAETKSAIGAKLTDGRKLSAYQFWGVITKDGERIRLTDMGWELARKPEQQPVTFRTILDKVAPYRSALEWIFHQEFDSVTNVDVAAHWHQHHADSLGTANENTMKDSAVCFFHLCQAADIGTLIVGRRGQATRLEIKREELRKYIEAGPSTPPWTQTVTESPVQGAGTPETVTAEPAAPAAEPIANSDLRVFIAHGKNASIVEQVKTMLHLAGIESEVAEEEETPAIPVSEKVFNLMRRCKAAIIIVSVEEGRTDVGAPHAINDNVLIEIGAAFLLYEKRVVLLWDKRLSVPSNLQGLYRCDFEGAELSWSAGMKLMKAIGGFRKQ